MFASKRRRHPGGFVRNNNNVAKEVAYALHRMFNNIADKKLQTKVSNRNLWTTYLRIFGSLGFNCRLNKCLTLRPRP